MASAADTGGKILDGINQRLDVMAKRTGGTVIPTEVLKLAEAYAWLQRPAQSHGGGAAVEK